MFEVALSEFTSGMKGAKKQANFATAMALTWTAQDIKKAEIKHMNRVFDNPTRFTLNSLYVSPARKNKHSARVWIKDEAFKGTAAAKYLQSQLKGGRRRQKRHEVLLEQRGILPKGKVAVPGAGARLNKAGNISRGQITRMLSNVGAQFDQYQNTPNKATREARGSSAKAKNFFVKRDDSGMPIAIYRRTGKRKAKPFLVFVSDTNYHKRLDFYGVAERTRNKRLLPNYKKAFKHAIRTAR